MQGQDNRRTRGVALFWRRTAVAGRTSAIALLIATGALVATPSLAAAASPAGAKNLAPKVFKLPQLPASFTHRTAKAGAARLPVRPRIAPRNAVFQTFVVDTGTDPASGTSCATGHAAGTCSLRAAIAAANADAGHIDAITIPSGTNVVLAQGLLDLTSSMYINGAGATVNGSGTGIFEELAGTSYPAVDITGLTLTGGAATNGGAIYCYQGSLVLSQVDITGNTASGSGGGLYSTSACELWMDGSTVSKNTASTYGGGLYLGGSANISRSTIGGSSSATGNIAPDGAGLYNSGGTVELSDSSVNYNSSPGLGVGVGVYNGDVLDVSNCTIDGNLAAAGANGAGVANFQTLAVTDSSISYNSVTGAAGSYP
jgi:predicted outer membrane repeat protein